MTTRNKIGTQIGSEFENQVRELVEYEVFKDILDRVYEVVVNWSQIQDRTWETINQ